MSEEKKEAQINVLWLPAILILGILYIISFIDVVPDAIPIFGQLDDVGVAIAVVWFFTRWLPKNMHRIYWFRPQSRPNSAGASDYADEAGPRQNGFDPFKVLHLPPGATENEIKRAYRELMAKYHPDKVNHLGEEFQRLAHGKVVEITKAYEMLSGKE